MADASNIVLLGLDVDGVLTDGSIYLDDAGIETKRFDVRDGFGLRLWREAGLRAAIITGRTGRAVQRRAAELGIGEVIQGARHKGPVLDALLARCGVRAEEMAYIGDDWPDLAIMRRVGLPIAVADAADQVRQAAALVTKAAGGRGAVREVIEHLLRAKGLYEAAMARYDPPA